MAKGGIKNLFEHGFPLNQIVESESDSFESFSESRRIIQEYADYFRKANAPHESFKAPVRKSCAVDGRKKMTPDVMMKVILSELGLMGERVLLGPIVDKYFVRGEDLKMEDLKMNIWEQMYERQGCFLK